MCFAAIGYAVQFWCMQYRNGQKTKGYNASIILLTELSVEEFTILLLVCYYLSYMPRVRMCK